MATDTAGDGELPDAAFPRLFRSAPVAFLVLRAADLVMVDANAAYLDQVQLCRTDLVGRRVFEVFPESSRRSDTDTGQTSALERLMRTAVTERRTTTVQRLRYDIPVGDGFQARWWNVTEVPILGEDGAVEFLLHSSEDVTELAQARVDLSASRTAQEKSARLVTMQAELALALTNAHSLDELEQIVVTSGLAKLGSGGGGLVSGAADGGWRVTVSEALGESMRSRYRYFPADSPLPAVISARRGERILLPDRASSLAYRGMRSVLEETGREAWACLPLLMRGRRLGSLVVSWVGPHEVDDDELELLDGIAAQCALALDRLEQLEAQQESARQVQSLAESLQNAMMNEPPPLPGLEVAVRYRSADDVAQVGGDWYDAFVQPDGAVMVTVGDVCGHDHVAAGKMGQLSGLLRALAFDSTEHPHGVDTAATLLRFEQVARALGVDELATVVLARIEPDGADHLVRWTNAGSPPPVLVEPDGTTRLLDDKPDVMLGVDEAAERTERVVRLVPGATLVLYTDGLIERRDLSIGDGLDELAAALGDLAGQPLTQLCDQVLQRLSPHIGEDDVALLAVRPRA